MDASIVIATYNRKDLLAACLKCLDQQDFPSDRFEVIVVDDGSTDGSVEMVQEMKPPYLLRCIPANHQGPGLARNLGVTHATGDIVIFLDSDAFAAKDFVAEHVKSHKQASSAIFVDGPAIYVSGQEAIENPPTDDWRIRWMAALDFFGAPFVSVNVSCPRTVFIEVGGFDERFGKAYGWEDTELGVRLRQAGLGNVRNRKAYVLHHRDGTPTLDSEIKKRVQCGANAALFYEKHPLPEVQKLIDWGSMSTDRLLVNTGIVKWLTPERAARWRQGGHIFYPVLRKLFLIHLYATELRTGLVRLGLIRSEA